MNASADDINHLSKFKCHFYLINQTNYSL